jgi:acetoin utilization deacetylase AcuC-like enzyme
MGFCLFNNIAVTAAYLRSMDERVAIVDWDVHHGNGTQHSFYDDPAVLYVSIHEFPFYPGTGWVDESGDLTGRGANVNIPLPNGTSASSYLASFARVVIPVVRQFDPDWILVSCGFDAHRLDPLGGLMLESEDYGRMAGSLASLVGSNRVISFLEGGYNLDALTTGAAATVRGASLDGSEGTDDAWVWPTEVEGSASKTFELAVESARRFWEID